MAGKINYREELRGFVRAVNNPKLNFNGEEKELLILTVYDLVDIVGFTPGVLEGGI